MNSIVEKLMSAKSESVIMNCAKKTYGITSSYRR